MNINKSIALVSLLSSIAIMSGCGASNKSQESKKAAEDAQNTANKEAGNRTKEAEDNSKKNQKINNLTRIM
ncbi:hypothetical protein [Candidatus Liberibacter brunswickensis]|uniref:hypothetical protein n=1 Tax=Candidatus Liberibacter brunswickensis TaxID=1968796 RepID=UPI002FE09B49